MSGVGGESSINSMFVSRRAICPWCGAPVALEGAKAQVSCGFCGSHSIIERRLRKNEPDANPQGRVEVEWTPAHLNPGVALVDQASCPGCGAELTIEGMQSIVRCEACSTEVKVERRTRLLPRTSSQPGEADAGAADLVRRLGDTSVDLASRVSLAKSTFEYWGRINRGLARHAAGIMRIMRDDDPRLAVAVGDAIGKLLCEGDVVLQNEVIAVADEFLRDPRTSPRLHFEIGLGPTTCLKPLLDAADVLWAKGDLAMSCQALLSANTLIGRHLGDKEVMAAIILYRLPYARGPALGWIVKTLPGGHPLYYAFPTETLLRFMDDCAFERPELLPEIAAVCRVDELEGAKAYKQRLAVWDELQAIETKEVFLRTLPKPPAGGSLRLLDAIFDLLLPRIDHPRLGPAVEVALLRMMEDIIPERIHALVRERGDALPEELRRAYRKKVPDTPHLSELPVKYWQSPKKREPVPVVAKALEKLEEGIDAAIALDRSHRQAFERYWAVIKTRTPLMEAAMRGDLAELEKLLAAGAEVDETNDHGRTAAMFAAEAGHGECVSALVEAGADLERADADGATAAALAAAKGEVSVLHLLPLDDEQRDDALRAAIAAQQLAAAAQLLSDGADPDLLDEDARSLLMHEVRAGREAFVELLLDAGARIEHADRHGWTALRHAVDAGRADMVAMLLARGADPRRKGTDGKDAVEAAAARDGAEAMLARLRAAGGG